MELWRSTTILIATQDIKGSGPTAANGMVGLTVFYLNLYKDILPKDVQCIICSSSAGSAQSVALDISKIYHKYIILCYNVTSTTYMC